MIYSPRFIAILDACVLYQAPTRDLLLSLAATDLYTPKWSKLINDEWLLNLLENRKDLTLQQLEKTVESMNTAFPDADVEGFETLIDALKLPDLKDRHVLAAAIRCNADVIVTFNLSDFPSSLVSIYDIEVQHPDKFICNVIDLSPDQSKKSVEAQIKRLKNPPLTKTEVLAAFERCGLIETVKLLSKILNDG